MATLIDSLFGSLGLQTKDIDREMKKAESSISEGFKNMAAKALDPFDLVLRVGSILSELAVEADSVGKFAAQMELPVEDVNAWSSAAKLAGGSAEALKDSLKTLGSSLDTIATTGTSKALPFLNSLGVASLDANGKARDTFSVMTDMAGAIEGMSKQGSSAMLSEMGLDTGTISLLQSGKAELLAQIQLQKELGVYTQKDTNIAEKFNNAIANLSKSLKMSFLPIARMLGPSLTVIAEQLTKMFVAIQKHGSAVSIVAAGIALALTAQLVPAILSTTAAFIASPIAWFLALLIGLGLIFDDLITYIEGGDSALQGFWSQFGTGAEIGKKLNEILDKFSELLKESMSFMEQYGAIIFTIIVALGSLAAIVKIAMAAWGLGAKVVPMIKMILGAVRAIISVAQLLGLVVGVSFGWIIAAIAAVIAILWYLHANWDELYKSFEDGLNAVLALFSGIAKDIEATWDALWVGLSEKLDWASKKLEELKSMGSKLNDLYFKNPSAELALSTSAKKENITNDTAVSIGEVNVNTQATNSLGIATSIGDVLRDILNSDLVQAANSGVIKK